MLYLSNDFKQHQSRYDECLQFVRDAGDWEGWLTFVLDGVLEVSQQATQTAAAILKMREDYRDRIMAHLGRAAANGHRVMERLFERPIISVATVREWLQVTPAGANSLVSRLMEIGLLREITGYARYRRFRFDPYLCLFEDDEDQRL